MLADACRPSTWQCLIEGGCLLQTHAPSLTCRCYTCRCYHTSRTCTQLEHCVCTQDVNPWSPALNTVLCVPRLPQVFQDVLAESNTVAEEALSMSRVVRTFGTEGTETRRYMGWLE